MYETLVTFGDSWPGGAELADGEKPFGRLLSEMIGCKNFYNYALPGSSVPHLIIQTKEFIKQVEINNINSNNILAVFFLTGNERFMYWDDQWINIAASGATIGPGVDRESANQHHELYYKHFHSKMFDNYMVNTVVLSLQRICYIHKIDSLFVNGWDKPSFWNEINLKQFYNNGETTCAEICNMVMDMNFSKNKFTSASGGHPNQLGHSLIANQLFKWIDSEAFFSIR